MNKQQTQKSSSLTLSTSIFILPWDKYRKTGLEISRQLLLVEHDFNVTSCPIFESVMYKHVSLEQDTLSRSESVLTRLGVKHYCV